MHRNLPPLAAVRVFEAAARQVSFTRAAEELGMTQAAVSYQIKTLEERVGAPLFLRRPRQVELTETGLRLAAASTQALDILAAAFGRTREDAAGKLTISTVPTLATNWLAPRLGLFQLANPSIAVRLETSPRYVDFTREDVDVAIRVGDGNWPGLAAHALLPTIFTPMLSPELAASIGGVNEPADLLRLPILTPTDPWWAQWLVAAGVSPEGLKGRPQNEMGSQARAWRSSRHSSLRASLLRVALCSPSILSARTMRLSGWSIRKAAETCRRSVPSAPGYLPKPQPRFRAEAKPAFCASVP